MTCAISMGKLVQAVPALANLGLFVPYVSVCLASAGNMFFTRMEEVQEGITVFDEDGRPLGKSKIAGFEAVWRTVTTRGWVTPIPILLIPPVLMAGLRKVVPLAGAAKLGAEVTILACCMFFALPYTLALQPQTMEFEAKDLEPEFADKVGAGKKIRANKGL